MSDTIAYIGLGSNLGDRLAYINKALKMLNRTRQIKVIMSTDPVETQPLGDIEQPCYLNAVAEIKTSLDVDKLYRRMMRIENTLGRERTEKWAPRTIDLDLLLFAEDVIKTDELTVPHSEMHLRSFVLEGIRQLNPQLRHPLLKLTVSELADRLKGCDFTVDTKRPQLVSIAGVIGVGKTTLVQKLAKSLGGEKALEPYDTNPYLSDVYAGNQELALHSQLYFLNEREKQLSSDTLKAGEVIFSDYFFDKEIIYGKMTLSESQFEIYEPIYLVCGDKIAWPVLIIYLKDTAANSLKRIRSRNRPYERKINVEFLESLNERYEKLLADWKGCPMITIDKSNFDCNDESDIEWLENQIEHYIVSDNP